MTAAMRCRDCGQEIVVYNGRALCGCIAAEIRAYQEAHDGMLPGRPSHLVPPLHKLGEDYDDDARDWYDAQDETEREGLAWRRSQEETR